MEIRDLEERLDNEEDPSQAQKLQKSIKKKEKKVLLDQRRTTLEKYQEVCKHLPSISLVLYWTSFLSKQRLMVLVMQRAGLAFIYPSIHLELASAYLFSRWLIQKMNISSFGNGPGFVANKVSRIRHPEQWLISKSCP